MNHSAVGLSALRALYDDLQIPVGGIVSAVGNTGIDVWQAPTSSAPINQTLNHFNARIAPVTNMNIRGFMWYQGENDGNNENLAEHLYQLVRSWRHEWRDSENELPFIFVNLHAVSLYLIARLQLTEAFTRIPNSGMVSAIDTYYSQADFEFHNALGTTFSHDDVHLGNKWLVGQRLAWSALAIVNDRNTPFSGPMFHSAAVVGNQVTLTFTHIGAGLATSDGLAPFGFQIQGEGGAFQPAAAEIIAPNQIRLTSDVAEPAMVQFMGGGHLFPMRPNNPALVQPITYNFNLFNSHGLPAAPFRVSIGTVWDEIIPGDRAVITTVTYAGQPANGELRPGQTVTVQSQLNIKTENGVLILAAYYGETIVYVRVADFTASQAEIIYDIPPTEVDNIRIFVWNHVTMQPYSRVIELN